jgi:hypothetical protein
MNFMVALQVVLDFVCYFCDHNVGVTLKCEGKGLVEEERPVASVNVPCPTCGLVNQLLFEPSGTVRGVAAYRTPHHMLEPSLN